MGFPFKKFDCVRTQSSVLVQVVLLSLIGIGLGLMSTERYWIPSVVSFLLAESSPMHGGLEAVGTSTLLNTVSHPASMSHPQSGTVAQPAVSSPMNTTSLPFTLSVPASSERGKPVTISWQLAKLSPHSSIGFILRGGIFVSGSPLTLVTLPLTETSGSFTWNGNEYGCDPVDTPTYCSGVATGGYTITAVVYDKTHVSLIDGDLVVPLAHPEKILYTASAPLVITGLPGPERIDTFKQVVANKINTNFLHEANLLALWDSTATAKEDRIKPYIHEMSPFTGPDTAGKFCMNFNLGTPFVGHVTICGPDKEYGRDTAGLFTTSGDVTGVSGVVTYQTAKQKVLNQVWSLYQHRVAFRQMPSNTEAGFTGKVEDYSQWIQAHPEADTYLFVSIDDWAYHTEDGGYFVYKVSAKKSGSADTFSDPFTDGLIIRVANTLALCVVQTYDQLNFTGSVLDIHTGHIVCPKV